MIDWSKYTPNLRDGFDFAVGVVIGKVVLPRLQGYVTNEIKNTIRSSYEENFAQERNELYKRIDLLTTRIDELTKKVRT